MEELRVRDSIRSLLLDSGYVHKHLTVDYKTVTADAVSEVRSLESTFFQVHIDQSDNNS